MTAAQCASYKKPRGASGAPRYDAFFYAKNDRIIPNSTKLTR
jgi:hypothetical protein